MCSDIHFLNDEVDVLKYLHVANIYQKIEGTTKRLEMTDYLVELLRETPPVIIDKVIYLTQGKLHPNWTGLPEIGIAEKMAARAVSQAVNLPVRDITKNIRKTGDLGFSAENLLENRGSKATTNPLTVTEVYDTLDEVAKESGAGSSKSKIKKLAVLIRNAYPLEAKYILRTVTSRLRLGIGDMTVLDALALAFTGAKENRSVFERAYNITSDLGFVARTVAEKGFDDLKKIRVVVGKPVRMMLAQRLATIEEIIEKLEGKCSAEYKLDGERFQLHKQKDRLNIYSRRLENITSMYPDVVKLASSSIKARDAIVEGEGVAVDTDTGELRPFQELMKRRRKYRVEEMAEKIPAAVYLFDCLYVDGEDLTTESYTVRRKRLGDIIEEDPRFLITPSLTTDDPLEMKNFFERAVSEGCEGLIIKSTDSESVYRAGARSWLWVKWKRSYHSKMVEPVDLTVVGAYMGRGKRAGTYGALLAAVYDEREEVFRTICKVGSGFTDEQLGNMPQMFKTHLIPHRHARVDSILEAGVWFEPAIVIEVIGDEFTLSPIHTCAFNEMREESGLAIRFPRFTGRWRPDKSPEDSTSVKDVLEMYKRQMKKISKS